MTGDRGRTRSFKGPLIAALVGVLALVVAGLLIWSRARGRQQRGEVPAPRSSAATAGSGAAPARSPQAAAPPTPDAGPRGADSPDAAPPRPRRRVRATAPAVIPLRIRRERDPKKRAKLLRMRRLATARVRQAMLGRRRTLLLETIAKAEGARASKRRLARLRADLAQLDKALEASAAELERARAAAKGTK